MSNGSIPSKSLNYYLNISRGLSQIVSDVKRWYLDLVESPMEEFYAGNYLSVNNPRPLAY